MSPTVKRKDEEREVSLLMSAKLWLVIQIGLDIVLVALFIVLIRYFRRSASGDDSRQVLETTREIEAVLNDAKKVAEEFEVHLKEKKAIVGRLNEQLDNRIINLNLLLSRADLTPESGDRDNKGSERVHQNSYDLQNEIVALSEKGHTANKIAEKLGVIKGEVDLVLDLKKKFQDMTAETAKI